MLKTTLLGITLFTDHTELARFVENGPTEKSLNANFPGFVEAAKAARRELDEKRLLATSLLHLEGRVQACAGERYGFHASGWFNVS